MNSPFAKLHRILAEIREGDPILRSRLGRAHIVEATLDQSPLPQPAAAEGTSMSETSDFIAKCEAFAREFPAATLSASDPTEEVEGAFSADRHTRLTAHRRMKLIARQRIDQVLASDLAATTAAQALAEEEQKKARDRELLERITASIMGFDNAAQKKPSGTSNSEDPALAKASAGGESAKRFDRPEAVMLAGLYDLEGANVIAAWTLALALLAVLKPQTLR